MSKSLFLFLLLLLSCRLWAQDHEIQCSFLSTDHGLSQSSVPCILQDSKGFMWFGTQDGLNKYDGYKFTVYRNHSDDSSTISENWVETMCEDSKGYLWFGTLLQGLNRYDRRTDKFVRYKHLKYIRINYLFRDSRQSIWVASYQGLCRIYYDATGKEQIQYFSALYHTLLKSSPVLTIAEDKQGNIWMGTMGGGLIKMSYREGQVEMTGHYKHQPGNSNSLMSNMVRGIDEDGSGNLWMATTAGLEKFHPATATFTHYLHQPSDPNSPAENDLRSVMVDSQQQVWIGTYTKGVNKLVIARNEFIRLPLNTLSDFNRIQVIYEDRHGIIWFGTMLGGISFYNPNRYYFKHYKKGSDEYSLNDNSMRAFFEDGKGTLWIATQNGGVNKFDRQSKKVTYLTRENTPLPGNNIRGVCTDSRGNLWAGFRDAGIFRLNINGNPGLNLHFKYQPGDSSALPSNNISNLWLDQDSVVWACTFTGALCRFDEQRQRFTCFYETTCAGSEYNEQNSIAVFDNRRDIIWVGGAAGLARMNKKTRQLEFFPSGEVTGSVLPVCNIKSIYEEKPGIVWLGTSKGLIWFNYYQKQYKLYEIKDGLPSEMIYGILADQKSNLWLSTNKGLSRFSIAQQSFKNYNLGDGLQHGEFNTGAFYKTPRGEMVFGGINGFNIFHPDSIRDNPHLPVAVITDFKIFNESVVPSDSTVLKHHISETTELELSYEDKVFSFEFVALNFSTPEKNQYAYRMEGFDDQWTYTDARYRIASYTNLPAGTYIFHVICSNNDGLWNREGTSIRITIRPPFWKAWWFISMLLISGSIGAYIWYGARIRVVERQKERLEKLVADRTAEVNIQKELVEKKNEDITASINYAQRIQVAMLPQMERVRSLLPESFILFMPRDIVSGDFYWVAEQDNKIIITAIDCTGHGVPGAFMSMIGNGILNQLIFEKDITKADRILNQLHKGVQNTLKQTETLNRDGMDVALCVIDRQNKVLEFAGAKNPLVYVRSNESGQPTLYEIKGDKTPIGGSWDTKDKDRVFTSHTVSMDQPGMYYLFSDGFQDQFGGEKGKKFMTKMFKELLLKIHHHHPAEQKVILQDTIKKWMGDAHPQIDDILVIGFRM